MGDVGTLLGLTGLRSMTQDETDAPSGAEEPKGRAHEENLADDLLQADPGDIAEFIASSLLEMRKLAVTFRMRFLVYLLEMAYQEADILAGERANRKDP